MKQQCTATPWEKQTAYVITRAGDFITIEKSEMDFYEIGGHDVFADRTKALIYFDHCRRSDAKINQTLYAALKKAGAK